VDGGTGVMVWTPFSVTLVNNIVVSCSVGISVSASAHEQADNRARIMRVSLGSGTAGL
jgi:hypothetical protein